MGGDPVRVARSSLRRPPLRGGELRHRRLGPELGRAHCPGQAATDGGPRGGAACRRSDDARLAGNPDLHLRDHRDPQGRNDQSSQRRLDRGVPASGSQHRPGPSHGLLSAAGSHRGTSGYPLPVHLHGGTGLVLPEYGRSPRVHPGSTSHDLLRGAPGLREVPFPSQRSFRGRARHQEDPARSCAGFQSEASRGGVRGQVRPAAGRNPRFGGALQGPRWAWEWMPWIWQSPRPPRSTPS